MPRGECEVYDIRDIYQGVYSSERGSQMVQMVGGTKIKAELRRRTMFTVATCMLNGA
jgi:hypothetical protein